MLSYYTTYRTGEQRMDIAFKEIANILDNDSAVIKLADTEEKDGLFLRKGGALYEIILPAFGELTASIHKNKLEKFKVEISVTIPGKR
jgi:hypothetical protein